MRASIVGQSILLALLLALPSVTAVPVGGDFRAGGSALLDGPHELQWDVLTASLVDADDDLRATVEVEGGVVTVVNQPRAMVVRNDLPEGRRTFAVGLEEEILYQAPVEGSINLTDHPVGLAVVRFLATGPLLQLASSSEQATIGPPGSLWVPPQNTTLAHDRNVTGTYIDPDGGTAAAIPAVDASFHKVMMVASSVHAVLPNGSHLDVPGIQPDPEKSYTDPLTGSGVETLDYKFLVVQADRITVHTQGGTWHLAARHLAGTLTGTAFWHGVDGSIDVQGDRNDDPTLLEVQGAIRLEGSLGPSGGGWSIAGEARQVRIDLVDRVSDASVAAGLSLLGLAAAALGLYHALPLAVGRMGRGNPDELLVHPGRRAILDAIHARQPVRLPDLQQATGMGRSALRYHLRMLEAAHVVQAHVAGPRNRTFMLNGGSLRFRVDAAGTPDQPPPEAAAVLSVASSHPVRAALYQEILRTRGADQDHLLESLRRADQPVGRSTCSYHLGKMVRAGLLRSEWRDGRKRFIAAVDAHDLRLEQYRRYLQTSGSLQLVQTLHREGPVEAREAAARLSVSAHRAEDVLQRLCRLGILDERGGWYHLGEPVAAIAPHLEGPS